VFFSLPLSAVASRFAFFAADLSPAPWLCHVNDSFMLWASCTVAEGRGRVQKGDAALLSRGKNEPQINVDERRLIQQQCNVILFFFQSAYICGSIFWITRKCARIREG
jgi:hypothetical protein